MSVTTSFFWFHVFGIWLSVIYKDFLIIKKSFQAFDLLILFYKDKLKMEHESATCMLWINMLHFYILLILGRS